MKIEKIDTSRLDKKKQLLLRKIGEIVKLEAITRVPIKTGALRNSITIDITDNKVFIGTLGIPYAAYVEYGTELMEASHGKHDPQNPVEEWKAKTKRMETGGVWIGQTMPFLHSADFVCRPKIKQLFKEVFR